MRQKKKLLAADLALSTDGGQVSASQGGIPLSMRGRVSFEIEAETATHDAHSGEAVTCAPMCLLVSLWGNLVSSNVGAGTFLITGWFEVF